MKRRIVSGVTALVLCLNLCLNLCPARAAGGEADTGLCPHHPAHTEACGYVPPAPGQDCAHVHDEDCFAEGCAHVHDGACGYAPESAGAPCGFACRLCPVEELMDRLPGGVTADNREETEGLLAEILALYTQLTDDEQERLDLSRCLDLQAQLDEANVPEPLAEVDDSFDGTTYAIGSDRTIDGPFNVAVKLWFDTCGHTFTTTKAAAISVAGTGELYLWGSQVASERGAGVEVQSGGFLSAADPGLTVSGKTYGLDVASGGRASLSGGTFTGGTAAIRTAGGDFGALLSPGCAYFDGSGRPIALTDVAAAKTVIVGRCDGHGDKAYTHTAGDTAHGWTCPYCGESASSEPCAFSFGSDGLGECACGSRLQIVIDESNLTNLVYDGSDKAEDVRLTVTLKDGSDRVLTRDGDYAVSFTPRKDAGEITVTVTGRTYGGTFSRTYTVSQDQPALEWDTASTSVPVAVDYDGSPVEPGDLPDILIHIQSNEDLAQYLTYSHKKAGEDDSAYTPGLPTNAGTYDVVARLPELPNYEAASSGRITLVVNKISPILEAPEAALPVYTGGEQRLVTAGRARAGAVIEFRLGAGGEYSADIPAGAGAGDYAVWYRVEESENYLAVPETAIPGVKIQRKPITPFLILTPDSFLYDGGYKKPAVTVKDGEDGPTLPTSEYDVAYVDNQDVSTAAKPAKVVVTDKAGGNYALPEKTEALFAITKPGQATLSITDKPSAAIRYGDQFRLSTQGGSGNGAVTWRIIEGADVAEVDADSGLVTVKGLGRFTVRATKSGTYNGVTNYEDAVADGTFTAEKRPVVALVTAESRPYDGTRTATVHAEITEGLAAGDRIGISGLTGAFSDENAGTGKAVSVDTSTAAFSGGNWAFYDITFSSAPVTADITRAVVDATPPAPASLSYSGAEQPLLAAPGTAVDQDGGTVAGVAVEYALSEEGPYSADAFPKGTDAGTYKVWYRVQETGNYTGTAPRWVEAAIGRRQVASPVITLSGDGLQREDDGACWYAYDGTAKEPAVRVEDGSGREIPSGEYTVAYSGNLHVGKATVTVTAKAEGNYDFRGEAEFTIAGIEAGLTEPTANSLTYNGQAQELVRAGSAAGGTLVYSLTGAEGPYDPAIPQGTNAGSYTVYYKVKGDADHTDTAPRRLFVEIRQREILPEITLSQTVYTYDGTAKAPAVSVKYNGAELDTGEFSVSYRENTDAGRATVLVSNAPGGNYIVNGSADFLIEPAEPAVNKPTGRTGLKYTGGAYELIAGGGSPDGKLLYSLDGVNYSETVPTATAVGEYTVSYKVQGDRNHKDGGAGTVTASIVTNEVTSPGITLSTNRFVFNGQQQTPDITLRDDAGLLIPESEYTKTITGRKSNNPVDVDTYTVTITNRNGNYRLNAAVTYVIAAADQGELTITGTKGLVYYGDTIQLDTMGAAVSGTVTWSLTGGTRTTIDPAGGLLKVRDVGGTITVTATRSAGGNYSEATATWLFSPGQKPVEAVLTGSDKVYDGSANATVKAAIAPGDLIDGDSILFQSDLTGEFDTADAGTNKRITVTGPKPAVTGTNAGNYLITYPATATGSIFPKPAEITGRPTANNQTYRAGGAMKLVNDAGAAVTGGVLVYSLNGVDFSRNVPTAEEAGTYPVYYLAKGDGNHTDSGVSILTVTVAQQAVTPRIELTPSTAPYNGGAQRPEAALWDGDGHLIPGGEYLVTYPGGNWTDQGTYFVTVEDVAGGNYAVNRTTAPFTITQSTQDQLVIVDKPGLVYYGDSFTLSATGGSGGAVTWTSSDSAIAAVDGSSGLVTVGGTGSVTITATRAGTQNHSAVTGTYSFQALPRPVTAIITADGKAYDGGTAATIHVSFREGDLIGADSIDPGNLAGAFEDARVGENKRVFITGDPRDDSTSRKYAITVPRTVTASISKAEAAAPSVSANSLTYTGSPLSLVSGGTADTLYSETRDGLYTAAVPAKTAAGSYTVWYMTPASETHNASVPKALLVTIQPKTVTSPVITLSGDGLQRDSDGAYWYAYDGTAKEPAVRVEDGSLLIPDSEYTVSYSGNIAAGGRAEVTVTDKDGGNYTVSGGAAFEIRSGSAGLTRRPKEKALTYTGAALELVTAGEAKNGKVVYGVAEEGPYEEAIPTGVPAGGYTVWYKVEGDAGYGDTAPQSVAVTIGKADTAITASPKAAPLLPGQTLSESALTDGAASVPGNFAWTDGSIQPVNGTLYEVTFTPADTDNYKPSRVYLQVSVTAAGPSAGDEGGGDETGDGETGDGETGGDATDGGDATTGGETGGGANPPSSGGGLSASTSSGTGAAGALTRTTVRNGAATTTVSAAAVDELAREAAARQSETVVIKPEITGNVTKAEVSLPSAAVSRLGSGTEADLTISTPVADVTISNGALSALADAGGTLSVAAEQVENAVAVTLTAAGRNVESVPGGVTLSLPAEDAGPGTVAVLVHEDGTQETVRKAVPEDGRILVPLEGSATVALVDNSKSFADVPDTSWAADAVAFASAHELFGGTSETTFSPDQPMSRAMLAAVLYNLEGRPALSAASDFSDVSSDAWYAEGVSFAAERGITTGYGDGQFGPDDNVTREQFAVMLWKYAGSPAAGSQDLPFTDADQVSGYAEEALRWATEKGVLNGHGDGRLDPSGPTTRAQAAQMLKNFMENT